MLAIKWVKPPKVPAREGAVSMMTLQNTECGSEFSALPNVISARTATGPLTSGMLTKHSAVAAIEMTATAVRAIRRLPVRARKRSEMRPPRRMVKQAPVHGIIPRYQSELREYPVSYTHLRAHETRHDLVCRLL